MITPTLEKTKKMVAAALEEMAPIKYQHLLETGGLPLFLERRATEMIESLEIEQDRADRELMIREREEPDFDRGPALEWRFRNAWSQILSSHLEFQDEQAEE
jgi:hypothetical protein